jgi:hypothetical protein
MIDCLLLWFIQLQNGGGGGGDRNDKSGCAFKKSCREPRSLVGVFALVFRDITIRKMCEREAVRA